MSRRGEGHYYDPNSPRAGPYNPQTTSATIPVQHHHEISTWEYVLYKLVIPAILLIIAILFTANKYFVVGGIFLFIALAWWVLIWDLNSFDAWLCSKTCVCLLQTGVQCVNN